LTSAKKGAKIQIVAPDATLRNKKHRKEESMNIAKLKAKLAEKEMNVETLGALIDVERSSLYRKLNNFEKITIGEAVKMKEVLGMSDAEATDIFLS
jgi:transcriptional regulator of acetoin/glycerol metabolism